MQIVVIEYAHLVMNLRDTNSTEFDLHATTPVVFMPEDSKIHMGGTMRLGSRRTYFELADLLPIFFEYFGSLRITIILFS
ncbi:hypothetical protein ZIOFF_024187 [Zingiber officinale]|uniref:Uncharacterized protein n=1 Tax=Zingiber officinale TaxID=94328 RepID=A0A8J5GTS4_ZINOF|nr:hypothetical protein ZIOFF_024187 [Zingiber officinale]